jgi:hypothetical protein
VKGPRWRWRDRFLEFRYIEHQRRAVLCVDCGASTTPTNHMGRPDRTGPGFEWYMVHDALWAQAGMPPNGGCLCVGCLELRLGRPLQRTDLTDYPINDPSWLDSPRMSAVKTGET